MTEYFFAILIPLSLVFIIFLCFVRAIQLQKKIHKIDFHKSQTKLKRRKTETKIKKETKTSSSKNFVTIDEDKLNSTFSARSKIFDNLSGSQSSKTSEKTEKTPK